MHLSLRSAGSVTKRLITGAVLLGGATLCVSCPVARAQDDPYSIRVESNEVVVPTLVFDKDRMHAGSLEEMGCSLAAIANCTFSEIRDLDMKDFHVFEDGVEQRIRTVMPDNVTVHGKESGGHEYSLTPRGN